jgi:hypothetical protein
MNSSGPSEGRIYRVFRLGRSDLLVTGEAELDAALRHKTAYFHEIALIHQCRHCGARGPFGPEWISLPIFGKRYNQLVDAGEVATTGTEVYCSARCWNANTGGLELPAIIDPHQEPRPPGVRNDWYFAMRDAERRQRNEWAEATKHRKVPMAALTPEQARGGWCRWCGLIVIVEKGKRKGQQGKGGWHPHCVTDYFLHSRVPEQFAFLVERDGRRCAWPGCDQVEGLEVEHRVPLWKVRDLSDDERRWYYGPGNLWLLCCDHHKAKSAAEAAERAALKRRGENQPSLI